MKVTTITNGNFEIKLNEPRNAIEKAVIATVLEMIRVGGKPMLRGSENELVLTVEPGPVRVAE